MPYPGGTKSIGGPIGVGGPTGAGGVGAGGERRKYVPLSLFFLQMDQEGEEEEQLYGKRKKKGGSKGDKDKDGQQTKNKNPNAKVADQTKGGKGDKTDAIGKDAGGRGGSRSGPGVQAPLGTVPAGKGRQEWLEVDPWGVGKAKHQEQSSSPSTFTGAGQSAIGPERIMRPTSKRKRGKKTKRQEGDQRQTIAAVGDRVSWTTFGGDSYAGVVREVDSNVLIVDCDDGRRRGVEGDGVMIETVERLTATPAEKKALGIRWKKLPSPPGKPFETTGYETRTPMGRATVMKAKRGWVLKVGKQKITLGRKANFDHAEGELLKIYRKQEGATQGSLGAARLGPIKTGMSRLGSGGGATGVMGTGNIATVPIPLGLPLRRVSPSGRRKKKKKKKERKEWSDRLAALAL